MLNDEFFIVYSIWIRISYSADWVLVPPKFCSIAAPVSGTFRSKAFNLFSGVEP